MRWLTAVLLIFHVVSGFAQDTESKDEITVIRVYVRIDFFNAFHPAGRERLLAALEKEPGICEVRMLPVRQVLVFYMYSTEMVSEDRLEKLVKNAGYIPVRIEYMKEEPEHEEDYPEVEAPNG